MSQVQELEAFDRYISKIKPTNVKTQKLLGDWKVWYSNLSWYDKNLSSQTAIIAADFRDQLIRAVNGDISGDAAFGAEAIKATGNYTKKGTLVPTPPGYRRAQSNEITPAVQGFAVAALNNFASVSKKKGEAAAIGMRYAGVVNGKQYLSQCEWHWDNHPKGGKGNPFWHMGSSIFVPIAPIAPPANSPHAFATQDPGIASITTGNNPYA